MYDSQSFMSEPVLVTSVLLNLTCFVTLGKLFKVQGFLFVKWVYSSGENRMIHSHTQPTHPELKHTYCLVTWLLSPHWQVFSMSLLAWLSFSRSGQSWIAHYRNFLEDASALQWEASTGNILWSPPLQILPLLFPPILGCHIMILTQS